MRLHAFAFATGIALSLGACHPKPAVDTNTADTNAVETNATDLNATDDFGNAALGNDLSANASEPGGGNSTN